MEQAKELFNAAIPKMRDALAFYTLERHLIMHCNITLEISELYRWGTPPPVAHSSVWSGTSSDLTAC